MSHAGSSRPESPDDAVPDRPVSKFVSDVIDVRHRLLLDFVGERFDEETPAERIDHVRGTRLLCNDLLGSEGDPNGLLAGQCEGFIVTVRVQTLRPTENARERLNRHADDVVQRLLGRQRLASRLRVELQSLARVGLRVVPVPITRA